MGEKALRESPAATDFCGGELVWRVLEEHRLELRGVMLDKSTESGLDPALAANVGNFVGTSAQRQALCDGEWDGYAETLRAHAVACAESGIELHAWFDVVEAGHATLQGLLGPQKSTVKAAMALREFTMAQFGAAYVEARARLLGEPEPAAGLFRLLFANLMIGALIYRMEDHSDLASFRLVCANPAAAQVSHPRIFEHVGKCLRETSPYLLETPVPRHYANAVLLGKSASWVISTGAEALATKTYAARCFPLERDHVAVTFEDITERREMELRIERHVAELERSNRELDDFAYVASHDLKGPLQDVKTLATWIQEDLGETLPKNTDRHVRTMVARVCRMERLLDDLLTYSRAGRTSAVVDELTVRDLFEEVLAVTSVPDGFTVSIASNVPRIRTPKAPLAQVVRNLVGNAIKHHDRTHGKIEISAADDGDRVRIVVADDGPGISPEFHTRAFRLFQTLRPRDELEGSGIGLAIVKKVVESHGGSVAIDSVSRGTAISFTWPKESAI